MKNQKKKETKRRKNEIESGGKKMRREGERNDSQFHQLQDSLGQRNRDQLIKHIISSSNGWKEEN